jgi:hypothetical protein
MKIQCFYRWKYGQWAAIEFSEITMPLRFTRVGT